MNWFILQTVLLEILFIMAISLPITWFFYGWAMAVVEAVTFESQKAK